MNIFDGNLMKHFVMMELSASKLVKMGIDQSRGIGE